MKIPFSYTLDDGNGNEIAGEITSRAGDTSKAEGMIGSPIGGVMSFRALAAILYCALKRSPTTCPVPVPARFEDFENILVDFHDGEDEGDSPLPETQGSKKATPDK